MYTLLLAGDDMFRTQIYLTEQEKEGLDLIAKKTGNSQSALIRQAIDEFIANGSEDDKQARENFMTACGIWADRPESDFDYRKLREEWDRDFS